MKAIIMRHGLTDWNVEDRYQGQSNESRVTETGKQQVAALLDALARAWLAKEVRAIYTSDLRRALETTEFVAARLGIKFKTEQMLREINVGEVQGMLKVDAREKFAAFYAARKKDKYHTPFPAGESFADCETRVRPFVDEIKKRHASGTILIVSHEAIGRALIATLLNLKPDDAMPIVQPNNIAYIVEPGAEQPILSLSAEGLKPGAVIGRAKA